LPDINREFEKHRNSVMPFSALQYCMTIDHTKEKHRILLEEFFFLKLNSGLELM
jgi:hypothetical protein